MELIIFWLIMGGVVAIVANSKGKSALAWFFYGALIWPIALVHIIVTKTEAPTPAAGEAKCPHCAETVKAEAKVCKHCGRDLPGVAAVHGA